MAHFLFVITIAISFIVYPTVALFYNLNDTISFAVEGVKFLADDANFPSQQVRDTTPSDQEEYDFIIIGAGSAGSAIAARLSEIPDAKVLVIEGGGYEGLIRDIPLLCLFLLLDKTVQWTYKSPGNNYCLGFENRQCKVVTGKTLGGTSAINFILATRGTKMDYDRWAEISGDESWSYRGMLKYFKKLETADVELTKVDPEFRNFNGPVRIADSEYHTRLIDAFIEAGRELGFSSPNDYNGEFQTGFSYLQTNQITGERLTANRAYLNPVRDRTNLFVTLNSQATKILIDPQTKTAYGVEFMKRGKKIKVRAKKEVILSAGALRSPKLLMLSGIGPARELKSLGIPLIQDAPVGENLMDHVTYPALLFLVNVTDGFVITDLLKPGNSAISEFLMNRKGPVTTPGFVEGFAYINVDDPSPYNEDPDMEFLFTTAHMGSTLAVHKAFGIDEKYFKESMSDSLYRHGYLIWPVVLHPKSRGKVSLQSADPKVDPIVDLNFYSDPDDLRVAVKGIRYAMKIANTKAMQKYGSQRFKYTVPGCHKYEDDSDDFWACALRSYSQTFWHYSGTCKMARENDPTSVVNSKLQVKNIKNLRVGDASIIPLIPAAHLNIPSMAIGEKTADIIKSDWGYLVT